MSQDYNKPIVNYSNGSFLIFKSEDAKLLRRRRILSQTIAYALPSTQPAGPPYCISHYAAHVIATYGLASFVRLEPKLEISPEDNKGRFKARLVEVANHEKEMHMMRRTVELRKRNLPVTPANLGEFNDSKIRLTISGNPDRKLASFNEQVIGDKEIQSVIDNLNSEPEVRKRMRIYHDLYGRGFFISSGMKFGCDFLAYMSDPVRFHAQYAIRLVECDNDGCLDLNKTSINHLNCLQRLTNTANKIPLFATVDNAIVPKVRYWTLKERAYLNSDSSANDLHLVDPRLELSSYEQIKIRRSS